MTNIKYLFFDLGHTLVNEDISQKTRIENAVKKLKEMNIVVDYDTFYNSVCKASKEYKSPFITALAEYTNDENLFIPYPSELETLFDDTKNVLTKLKEKYHLAVIANQFKGTNDRLKAFEIYDLFDFILASSDVGVSKPNSLIFEKALKMANCEPSQAVMIGDRIDNDIFPAKKMGMKTIWVKQGYGGMQEPKDENYVADFCVSSLSGLLKIL